MPAIILERVFASTMSAKVIMPPGVLLAAW